MPPICQIWRLRQPSHFVCLKLQWNQFRFTTRALYSTLTKYLFAILNRLPLALLVKQQAQMVAIRLNSQGSYVYYGETQTRQSRLYRSFQLFLFFWQNFQICCSDQGLGAICTFILPDLSCQAGWILIFSLRILIPDVFLQITWALHCFRSTSHCHLASDTILAE